jgi:hypothetical protein
MLHGLDNKSQPIDNGAWYLYGYSDSRDALPLEPAELVRDWQENIREMQKRGRSVKR